MTVTATPRPCQPVGLKRMKPADLQRKHADQYRVDLHRVDLHRAELHRVELHRAELRDERGRSAPSRRRAP